MSVLMVMEAPGATVEQYERTNEILGISGDEDAPDGLIQHVAAMDGDTLVIADVWESEEALGRFYEERLGAALDESGVGRTAKRPQRLAVHNSLTGKGSEAGVLMLIEIADLGRDAYDQMVEKMEAHYGDGSQHPCTTHVAAKLEGGGLLVADLWESPEAFGKFAEEQIGPAGGEGLGSRSRRAEPARKEVARQLPGAGGGLGAVEHRRLVVVERVAAVLLDRDLPVGPRLHHGRHPLGIGARDVRVLAAEVEQGGARDRVRGIQRVRDPRAVVADDRVGIGRRAQAERESAA